MNKSEFLNELENKIRVLEKDEIRDILAEYSQHIEMRIESGLSEAEAIKDFGSVDELTSEILEAYHVNPEYERETESSETLETENKGSEKRKASALVISIFVQIWTWIKKLSITAVNGCNKLLGKIEKLSCKLFSAFKKKNKKMESSEKIQLTELPETKNIKLITIYKYLKVLKNTAKEGLKSWHMLVW